MGKEVLSRLRILTLSITAILLAAALTIAVSACGDDSAGSDREELIIASTTSTKDSGLFDDLLPAFQNDFPHYDVKVLAVGTGEALKLGEKCDADVLLVHDPEGEKKFVEAGYGRQRLEVMYNDFVILGPATDPAAVGGSEDAAAALRKIAGQRSPFVSRGDESGTHKAELRLWKSAGIDLPDGDWYLSTGQGMGETLRVANEKRAYLLADRSSWLKMRDQLPDLEIAFENDPSLFNQYGVIAVSDQKCPQINSEGATHFAAWIVSETGQQAIGAYGRDRFGQPLFFPSAAG